MKLKHKIALACSLLIALSSLLSAVFLYSYVATEIRETAYVNTADMMTQVSNFFDEKLKGIIRRVYAFQLNEDFNKSLSAFLFNDEKYRYAIALSSLSGSFSEIRSTEAFISSVFMYTPKGEFFDLAKIKNQNFDFKKSQLYQEIHFQPGLSVYWGSSRKDEIYYEGQMVVPLVFQFSLEGYNGELLLVVNLDQQAMVDYFNHIYSEEGNWIFILDHDEREVVSTKERATEFLIGETERLQQIFTAAQGSIRRKFAGSYYMINYQGMTVAPWKIVNIRSERNLLHKVNAFGVYLSTLTGGCIIGSLIFALILAHSITHPLALLERTIQKVTERDFNVKFNYKYQDEVGRLGNSFNFMVAEIREMVDKLNEYIIRLQQEKEKVRHEQQLKRQAELKALQAQINPHFLYNTLDSIHWMADKINAMDISRMTMALGMLFRTSLNKGRDFISIQDEVENVNSYLIIQKTRYGDLFDYLINIDGRLLNLLTIKLILQPLVENAIYHGVKEKNQAGIIEIHGEILENDGDVQFIISDNGMGMKPLMLDFINQKLEKCLSMETKLSEDEGYGIYNVNERIKLYFGERYGLHYQSEWGQGTEVRILIPQISKEELWCYVQTHGD